MEKEKLISLETNFKAEVEALKSIQTGDPHHVRECLHDANAL